MNVVTYDEGSAPKLEDKLYLEDAISDLPAVCIFCVFRVTTLNFKYGSLVVYIFSFHFHVFCRWQMMKTVMKCHMTLIPKLSFKSSLDQGKKVTQVTIVMTTT